MKTKGKEVLAIVIVLIIQSIIYIFVGMEKSYIHIDEAYSYGLTNYNKVEIQNNKDFYNEWHSNKYYEDYLSIQKDEIFDFKPVYENQKNDVHPPLYYLLLRIAMEFTIDHFTKWSGIILNIIIYIFVTIFMYLILKRLFKEEKYSKEKAIILAFMSSIILASLSNVVYIRMYSLLTLEILITTFLHIKLLEDKNLNSKMLICLGISVLAGILTHYYYLFYLAFIYLIFMIKYIKQKERKSLIYYTATIIIAGIMSLIIFPYSIKHMFFGYRGQGAISNLGNIHEIIPSIFSQMYNINYYVFNNLTVLIIAIIIGIIMYRFLRKKGKLDISKDKREILKIITIPTILFFLVTSVASPWQVLRYIVPVCGLIFVLVIYYLYELLRSIASEKLTNILMSILFCMILISPFIFDLKPELLYQDKKEIVQELSGELNLPTVYLFNSKNGGFLDDILLFSKINESYIAKDIEYTKNNLQEIVENKDISHGMIIFINEKEKNNDIAEVAKKDLDFQNCNHLKTLNGCDVYYLN